MDYKWVEDKLDEVNARLERLEAMIPKSVSASSAVEHENKGDGMATKSEMQAADYRAEVTAQPAPETNQIHRVTLELTGRFDSHPSTWPWESIFNCDIRVILEPGDSVRVVVDEDREASDRVSREEGYRVLLEELLTTRNDRDAAIREREELREQLESVACRAATAETALEAASGGNRPETPEGSTQSASGGGEGEPVAWGVIVGGKIDQHAGSDALFVDNEEAQEWCHDAAISNRGTVVPLYRATPQPRGWLTEDEREAVVFLMGGGRSQWPPRTPWEAKRNAAIDACRQLLASSSPPEVVLPKLPFTPDSTHAMGWWEAIGKVKRALAWAGVAVKEAK